MWFFSTLIFAYIPLCILAAVIARNKGRSGIGFCFLSLILSPGIGIVAALIARPNTYKVEREQIATGQGKRCPYCSEIIKTDAIVCKFCGKDNLLNQPNYSQGRYYDDIKVNRQPANESISILSPKQIEAYKIFLNKRGYELSREGYKWIIHLPNGTGKMFAYSDKELVGRLEEIEGYGDQEQDNQDNGKDEMLFCALCGSKTCKGELKDHNEIKICTDCYTIKKGIQKSKSVV